MDRESVGPAATELGAMAHKRQYVPGVDSTRFTG
jgi:hypothetical protein